MGAQFRPYYTSPAFLQMGSGRRALNAHTGAGFGSFFSSIGKMIMPMAKKAISSGAKIGNKIVKSDIVQRIAKDFKNTAAKTGLDLAATALAGDASREGAKTKIKDSLNAIRKRSATKLNELGQSFDVDVNADIGGKKKKKKKMSSGNRGKKKRYFSVKASSPETSLSNAMDLN